jgi:hypothetical protein
MANKRGLGNNRSNTFPRAWIYTNCIDVHSRHLTRFGACRLSQCRGATAWAVASHARLGPSAHACELGALGQTAIAKGCTARLALTRPVQGAHVAALKWILVRLDMPRLAACALWGALVAVQRHAVCALERGIVKSTPLLFEETEVTPCAMLATGAVAVDPPGTVAAVLAAALGARRDGVVAVAFHAFLVLVLHAVRVGSSGRGKKEPGRCQGSQRAKWDGPHDGLNVQVALHVSIDAIPAWRGWIWLVAATETIL